MRSPPEHKCTDACEGMDDSEHDDLTRAERQEWLAGYGDYLYDQAKDDRLTGDRE